MKKPLSFILSAVLVVGCVVPAAAAEPVNNVPAAIVLQEERVATKADIYEELAKLDIPYPGSAEGYEEATVEDFLTAFAHHNRYIVETADGFYYPLGDSAWMSAKEWEELVTNMDNPILLSQVQDIVQRTIECNELLNSHNIPDSYERYKDVIDAFYGEFSSLVASNRETIKYWVNIMTGAGGVYNPAQFSSVLHETAHEVSAKKANDFQRRSHDKNTWQVIWAHTPSAVYSYNPKTGENEKVTIQKLVNTLSIVSAKHVPENVRKTNWYKAYFAGDSASCTFGVYGMLEEYCASAIDIRCHVISSTIKYHEQKFFEDYLQSFYFWDGAIGTYLSRLAIVNPKAYNKIMSDEVFIKVLTDTTDYINEQTKLVPVVPTGDEDVIALREWAKTAGFQTLVEFQAAVAT